MNTLNRLSRRCFVIEALKLKLKKNPKVYQFAKYPDTEVRINVEVK